VVPKLGLSFSTVKQLNDIIDGLPGRPPFLSKVYEIGGEALEFYYRDIVPCLRALYGDPEFKDDLIFAPERHFMTEERTCRVYNEMHTGDWWWSVQVRNRKPSRKQVSNVCPRIPLSHEDQARPSYPLFSPLTKPS
jgi:Plavaka transposase